MMADDTWFIHHPVEGDQMVMVPAGESPHDHGYSEEWTGAKIERPVDTRFEAVDLKTGKIIVDEQARAAVSAQMTDEQFRRENGDWSIDIMHLRKALEARARDADPTAPAPVLEAEAAATGVAIDDLVAKVIAHDDETIGFEVARRQEKVGE